MTDYLLPVLATFAWQMPVLDWLNTPPGAPAEGARYLIESAPTGAWVGRAGQMAEWNGSAWEYTEPAAGMMVLDLDQAVLWRYDSSWHVASHAQGHALVGSDHTAAGLTTGHFLKATGPTAYGFAAHGLTYGDVGAAAASHTHPRAQITDIPWAWTEVSKAGSSLADLAARAHAALTGIGANDHHAQSHVLATNAGLGADHTISGAAAGYVLRASGPTAAAFAAIQEADLPSSLLRDAEHAADPHTMTLDGVDVSAHAANADAHHAQVHAHGTHTGLDYASAGHTGFQPAGNYLTALTGEVTASGPGSAAATIANDAVTFAKLQNIATASLLGRATAGTGNVETLTDIPAAITIGGKYVYRAGGTDVAVADGGTALSAIAAGSVLAATAANVLAAITSTSGLKVLQNNAGTISWVSTTGSGSSVLATSPALVTPLLGVAAATSLALAGATNPLLVVGGASGGFRYLASFVETGQSAQESAILINDNQKAHTLALFGDGAAFFMGRDVTNSIEIVFGTSALGAAFLASMTAHDLQLRTANLTRFAIGAAGHFTVTDGNDFLLGTSSGHRFGTAANQKLGFYGATPVGQQSHVADPMTPYTLGAVANAVIAILSRLEALGLFASA